MMRNIVLIIASFALWLTGALVWKVDFVNLSFIEFLIGYILIIIGVEASRRINFWN